MARLSELMKEEREITFEHGGESMTIVYKPAKITANWQRKMRSISEQPAYAGEAAAAALADVLVRWDLLEDDDTPVEISANRLRRIPMSVLGVILRVINMDLRAGTADGKK